MFGVFLVALMLIVTQSGSFITKWAITYVNIKTTIDTQKNI